MQVSRFLRETLEAYASESIADEVLRTALGLARLRELPTTPDALRPLIEVHLVQSATAVMGAELAEAVRMRLAPLLSMVGPPESAQEDERVTVVPGDGFPGEEPITTVTTRPPPCAATTPAVGIEMRPDAFDDRTPTRELEVKPFSVVLVAGREPDVATQLKQQLETRTAVIPVDEPARLVRDLRVLRSQPRMLILDVRKPHGLVDAIRGEPELLDGAIVLLWGASRELDADLKSAFPGARVVRCAKDASLSDLAAVVRIGPGK